MLLKTRAVVLDITPYAEASIIVKAYTESHGLQSFLVNGVRKQKARYANNLFQPLTLIEMKELNLMDTHCAHCVIVAPFAVK